MATLDYYIIMGVEPSATPEAIKQAHRRLAKQWHPDVNKNPEAKARFVEAQNAYETLINPQKRAAYDSLRANVRRPTSDHFRSERTSSRRDPKTLTIDDFVSNFERYASARMRDAAESTYRSAEQFAGRQPDKVTAEKLRNMKYYVLEGYATQVQHFASVRMMDLAEFTYRSAEKFAGNDQDRGILTRLYNMRKLIKK